LKPKESLEIVSVSSERSTPIPQAKLEGVSIYVELKNGGEIPLPFNLRSKLVNGETIQLATHNGTIRPGGLPTISIQYIPNAIDPPGVYDLKLDLWSRGRKFDSAYFQNVIEVT